MDKTDPLAALHSRPGFMLRRAHQIAVSVFLGESAELGVTPTQYGILYLLNLRPALDQASVARLLGLDRSTTALVVKKLEADGNIARHVAATDRRRHSLALTDAGRSLLAEMTGRAQRSRDVLVAPLTPDERVTFLKLLEKFNAAFNETSRVPLLASKAELPSV